LEEHLALVSADWQTGGFVGDFAADGYPQIRYSVTRSDAAVDGGITDQLMAVTATVWEDADGDATPDTGEPVVVFSGKVANLASYQAQVNP
jgi:hypothetical protein